MQIGLYRRDSHEDDEEGTARAVLAHELERGLGEDEPRADLFGLEVQHQGAAREAHGRGEGEGDREPGQAAHEVRLDRMTRMRGDG